jgi:protocatechuate 3,4-dioxygenase beta subunit
MKFNLIIFIILFLTSLTGCAQNKPKRQMSNCEDCELMQEGIPTSINWETKLANATEPGERMVISGTIYKPDGKTPASDIILYVYHTDANGLYSPSPDQISGKQHGHLRGWMKTDSQGRYKFETIRPASYPNRKAPQHIHPIIQEPDSYIYWIDEYLFDDDPNLTVEEKNRQQKRGGSGIIHLVKDARAVWSGQRNIVLGKNVPGY